MIIICVDEQRNDFVPTHAQNDIIARNTEIFKVVHSPDAMQSSIHYLNMLGECESSSSLTIAASFRMLAHQSCS